LTRVVDGLRVAWLAQDKKLLEDEAEPEQPSIPLKYLVMGYAIKGWDVAQTVAFYGFVPLVLYVGARRSGFTSVWDFSRALRLPLT
jgi:hypothetical protein